MMDQFVEILTIPFIQTTKNAFVNDVLCPRIMNGQKTFVVTANPEIVEYANVHEEYKKIILAADYITPDGIGIIYASKWLQKPLVERITGFDLMHDLLDLANKQQLKVYMLGSEAGVIGAAVAKVKKQYPNVDLVGSHHGYIDLHDEILAKSIANLEPDLIITALGFPKQEIWASTHQHLFKKGLFIGVGGSFDVLAGKVHRAPLIWQKLSLEWLYRLLKQPSRFKRMLVLPKFAINVLRWKRE